ncbi:MAG: hsdS [Streptosporangiaceae bacterium]|nr:hsdS [Streptosporangiaceae bacterium]
MSAWRTASIGEVVRIVGGGTPTRSNADYYDGEIPWVTPKDMKAWDIFTAQVNITQAGLDNSSARLVPENSVLIVVRSGVLKHTLPVALSRRVVAINQDMKALICSDEVDPGYLARFIKERSGEILQWVRATTADNFPIDKLGQFNVPLPPLPEQRRIAEVLDRIDALRTKRREAIALLGDLTRSIFLDMFGDPIHNNHGWPRVSLGSLLDRIDSGSSPNCLARPAVDSEWGVLKLGAVTRCEYNPGQNKALPESQKPIVGNEVKPGDLLFSRKNTRELVGASAIVHETPPRLLMPDLIFRLVPKPDADINKTYLHALMTLPPKRRKIQELASGSAGSMPNIPKGRLVGLDIEFPPIALQEEFAIRISAIHRIKATHQAHLDELDALFASAQHRAFRGELWDDPLT